MKFYYVSYVTRHNGVYIGEESEIDLTNEEVHNKVINLTWDNLADFYYNNGLNCFFNIWNFKKGRLVSFFSNKLFPIKDCGDIKEWKEPLNIDIEIEYQEYFPSINEVLNWHDGERAVKYLKQLK